LEAVLVETFDVVGGIGLFGGPLDLVENVEKAVEPDGRPPEGSPIIPHIQILLGARWVRAGSGHRPAPVSFRGTPKSVPVADMATSKKFGRPEKISRGRRDFFCRGLAMVNPILPAYSRAWRNAAVSLGVLGLSVARSASRDSARSSCSRCALSSAACALAIAFSRLARSFSRAASSLRRS